MGVVVLPAHNPETDPRTPRLATDSPPMSTPRSSVAATDAFYGDDLSPIPAAHLEHIDDVLSRLTARVAMEQGDVVLLDSYQVLHGRDTFDGFREHGVLWLTRQGPPATRPLEASN